MRTWACCLLACCACAQPLDEATLEQTFPTPFSSEAAQSDPDAALAPLPQQIALDPRKVALGRRLYLDPRLSGDGRVTCASCHAFDHGGAIAHARSDLPGRPPVAVNVPSLLNASFNFRFAWNGRFTDIGRQLDVAMTAPAAMASGWADAVERLRRDPQLTTAFQEAYAAGLTAGALREVMALYCLSLVTPNARLDRHLRGELQLSALEAHGFELFRDYGCIGCHQGINVGGNLLQRFGVMRDYFAERGTGSRADLGLYDSTHDPADLHVFRVPSLRNVALTAPYFHDGSALTLEAAVGAMATYQLGRELGAGETEALVAFLHTLSGELEGRAL